MNRYAYCVNNPVMYADPSGESCTSGVGGAWSKTASILIDDYVQVAPSTVNSLVGAAKQTVGNGGASASERRTKAVIKEAQAAIKELSSTRETYEAERQLIVARACARAVGDKRLADELQAKLELLGRLEYSDWRFLTGGMFSEEDTLEKRVAVLDRLKASGGRITLEDLLEIGIYTEEDLPKTWWQRVLATVNFGGVYYYASTLEEEYRLAQYGTTLHELSLEYQEKYQQQQGMLVTMALAQLGYNATSRALYGPALNPATAYSPDSRLDQIEKTGVDPGSLGQGSYQNAETFYSGQNAHTGLDGTPLKYNGSMVQSRGFDSYRNLKNHLGPAGEGRQWHHIVEQSQIQNSGFSSYQVHNTNNVISVPGGAGSVHARVSAYYSSRLEFTNGQTIRQWLAGQNFEFQFDFGMDVLSQFGEIIATDSGWLFIPY